MDAAGRAADGRDAGGPAGLPAAPMGALTGAFECMPAWRCDSLLPCVLAVSRSHGSARQRDRMASPVFRIRTAGVCRCGLPESRWALADTRRGLDRGDLHSLYLNHKIAVSLFPEALVPSIPGCGGLPFPTYSGA